MRHRLSSEMRNLVPLATKHGEFLRLMRAFNKDSGKTSGRILSKYLDPNQHCREIVLSNRLKRNSVSAPMFIDLAHIVDDIYANDNELMALVLRGRGNFFCSGLDLNLAKQCLNTPEKGLLMQSFMTDALNRIRNASAVSVCVLNGPAIGGGSELITATDFRLMVQPMDVESDQDSSYIQSVHARIGAAPGWGGATRLYDIVGRKMAIKLYCSSHKLTSREAMTIGLIDGFIPLSNVTIPDKLEKEAYINDNDEYDDEKDFNARLISHSLDFLAPYLKQPYPQSVRGIKSILSDSHKGDDTDHGVNDNDTMEGQERRIFAERWFSKDNKNALGIKE